MNTLRQIWNVPELRNAVLFVIGMLIIFRFVAAIPLPGVDPVALKAFLDENPLLGLVSLFSGGGLERFSLLAIGIAPYITASIIIQLLTMIVPALERLSKEGEYGKGKITQYTRYLTVPLAMIQGYGVIALLRQSSQQIFLNTDALSIAIMILTMTAGTIFMMWLGELISEKKVGNGISLLIFAGIVSGLPGLLSSLQTIDSSQVVGVISFTAALLLLVAFIVFVADAQRNVPVQYAKQVRGSRLTGGSETHLPLKINQAGMIPIIFAVSIILFPPTIAQFFLQARSTWVVHASEFVIRFFSNQLYNGIVFFVLVMAFTYFYTAIIFKPAEVAENIQKQGGFIPGIRPGSPTAEYLAKTMSKIVLPGALFLAVIATIPQVVQAGTGITNLSFSGASVLIVVGVVIEIFKQIKAQMTMRDYDDII
ncbi:MAG: preprotein translocase subunit SecY [bacterium]|nr:preprotein translocase subunit SecY [bacterium]